MLLAPFAWSQQPTAASDYHSDPKFQKQFKEASELSRRDRDAAWAADAWRKANKTASNRCMECFAGLIHAEARRGDLKRAAEAARAMDAAAQTPKEHFFAEYSLGQMLLGASGSSPASAALTEAHSAFQAAIHIDPTSTNAIFADGRALATMGDDAGAAEAFRAFLLHAKQNDPLRTRATHFADNPDLARHKMAPALVVNTLAGKQFNLDAMSGKVVLIDFWATWCGPCKEELPHMQKLAQKFAGEPFEVISVSWDSDEAKWKSFIAEHGMTWNQYRDADHALSTAFNVNAIPHYFTIDADGVLTAENVGAGSNIEDRIKKLLKRARESTPAPASSISPAAPPNITPTIAGKVVAPGNVAVHRSPTSNWCD